MRSMSPKTRTLVKKAVILGLMVICRSQPDPLSVYQITVLKEPVPSVGHVGPYAPGTGPTSSEGVTGWGSLVDSDPRGLPMPTPAMMSLPLSITIRAVGIYDPLRGTRSIGILGDHNGQDFPIRGFCVTRGRVLPVLVLEPGRKIHRASGKISVWPGEGLYPLISLGGNVDLLLVDLPLVRFSEDVPTRAGLRPARIVVAGRR